jgi:hypothetical protein
MSVSLFMLVQLLFRVERSVVTTSAVEIGARVRPVLIHHFLIAGWGVRGGEWVVVMKIRIACDSICLQCIFFKMIVNIQYWYIQG